MRSIATSLAALLSLLLVSAPVSAWACDFSCSSHEARFDCHTSTSSSKDDTAMSMPAGMDMGSDHSERSMGPETDMNAIPGYSMSMPPQQEMASERFEHATAPEMNIGGTQNHSKSMSSCTHETCSQVSTSASPPGADHSQPNSLHQVAISISSPANLWISFDWIRPGISPPELLAADRLVTTLRI
jgi:hypothetical protein